MIESRGMRFAGHVALLGKKMRAYNVLVGKEKERYMNERIILKYSIASQTF
jgi:hypothetical protein